MLQATLTLHTVWSICVPIGLVEAFSPDRTRPWFGRLGLTMIAAVFIVGSTLLAVMQYLHFRFIATPVQWGTSAVVIVGVIAAAFVLGRRPRPRVGGTPPRPRTVGGIAFGASSLYWLADVLLPDTRVWEWGQVGGWFVLVAALVAPCLRWSRHHEWSPAHRLALVAGALLTYAWVGFVQARELDVPTTVAVLGNVVFAAGAVALIVVAGQRLRAQRSVPPPNERPGETQTPGTW